MTLVSHSWPPRVSRESRNAATTQHSALVNNRGACRADGGDRRAQELHAVQLGALRAQVEGEKVDLTLLVRARWPEVRCGGHFRMREPLSGNFGETRRKCEGGRRWLSRIVALANSASKVSRTTVQILPPTRRTLTALASGAARKERFYSCEQLHTGLGVQNCSLALSTPILEQATSEEDSMAQVHANARARVYDYDAAEDALVPLPPPPRPQARPSLGRGIPSVTAASAAARHERYRQGAVDDSDGVAPQPAPVPHEHPLAALAHIGQRCAHPGVAGKRLNPAFFNRERVAAFVEKGTRHELQEEDSDDQEHASQQVQTLHSTRVLQRKMQQVAAQKEVRLDLEEEDKVHAATAASHWRHKLHPLPLQTTGWSAQGTLHNEAPVDSALERARVRKVKKQVNPKWLQEQQDSANRPRNPLERDDELHVREQLLQTAADELLASRVLFDDEDAARIASFPAVHKPALPVYSSGTTGLPGCCFDAWSY